jgi:demethylmenaquinone methyltransferase/2-methoxy-6-polyprenyl-1,4-benzoquinol methylase
MLTVEQIREVYRRIARRYDRAVALFPVFGVRMGRYRRDAVVALGLAPGQTVVELGCGTGLNFPLLLDAVGPHGHVIGVDLSDAMLVQARGSIQHRGWRNVELVCADIADYGLPPGVDAVLSTFAITLVPAFDEASAARRPPCVPAGAWPSSTSGAHPGRTPWSASRPGSIAPSESRSTSGSGTRGSRCATTWRTCSIESTTSARSTSA